MEVVWEVIPNDEELWQWVRTQKIDQQAYNEPNNNSAMASLFFNEVAIEVGEVSYYQGVSFFHTFKVIDFVKNLLFVGMDNCWR